MKFDSSQTDPEEVQQLRDSLLAGQGADSVSPSGVGDIAAVDPVGDDQSRAGAADRGEPPYVDAGAPQVDEAAGAHAAIDSGPVAPGAQSFEAGPPQDVGPAASGRHGVWHDAAPPERKSAEDTGPLPVLNPWHSGQPAGPDAATPAPPALPGGSQPSGLIGDELRAVDNPSPPAAPPPPAVDQRPRPDYGVAPRPDVPQSPSQFTGDQASGVVPPAAPPRFVRPPRSQFLTGQERPEQGLRHHGDDRPERRIEDRRQFAPPPQGAPGQGAYPLRPDAAYRPPTANPAERPAGYGPPYGPRFDQGAAPAPSHTGGYGPPSEPSTHYDEERALQSSRQDFTVRGGRREDPQQGWRSVVARMGIPVGKGAEEQKYDNDIAMINKRLRYRKTVGVVAFKGGVGKTSITMALASTVAKHRQEGGVVAIDTVARGTLALRVKGEQPAGGDVRSLASDADSDIDAVSAHLMSNQDRLSVLGSHRDLLTEPLQASEYTTALEQLRRHHKIVFVDTEPSTATPAYETIMASLDALILVVTPSRDTALLAKEVLPWLRARGLVELATRTVVLLNHATPAKPHVDKTTIAKHFHADEKVEVLEIPYDEHLAEASPVSLALLDKTTRRQFVRAAAILLDKLPAN